MTIADALYERGREEGFEQGLEESRGSLHKALEVLLLLRFQLMQEDVIRLRDDHLASATAEQLAQWIERAIRVERLDDVFLAD